MARYIDAEMALKIIDSYAKTVSADGKVVVDAIRDIVQVITPTADVVPKKKYCFIEDGKPPVLIETSANSKIIEEIDNRLHNMAMEYADAGHLEYYAVCEMVHHKVIRAVEKKYTEGSDVAYGGPREGGKRFAEKQILLYRLKREVHDKAVRPHNAGIDAYISLKVFDAILQGYLNKLE